MAVKEIQSTVKMVNAAYEAITSDTDTTTTGIDTAGYDLGVSFAFRAATYTDGTYVIAFEEADDNATWTAVPSAYIVGDASNSISAVSVVNDEDATFGIISAKRYLRAKITSTATTSGAVIIGTVALGGELKPV